MRITNVLLTLSSIVLASGCAYQQGEGTYRAYGYSSPTSHGSQALAAERAADRSLEDSCRYEITRYGDLAAASSNLQIACRDGVVTLSGSVPNERDKEMMEACVKNTSGVLRVDNQLAVIYAPTGTSTYNQSTVYRAPSSESTYAAPPAVPIPQSAPPASPEVTGPVAIGTLNVQVQATTDADRDCAQRIIDTVRADPVLTSETPTVTVSLSGGRAFIYGTAESRPQRRAIVDAVRRVPGVVDVRDDIRIR
jgi:osmotically-inducible protein OsmY